MSGSRVAQAEPQSPLKETTPDPAFSPIVNSSFPNLSHPRVHNTHRILNERPSHPPIARIAPPISVPVPSQSERRPLPPDIAIHWTAKQQRHAAEGKVVSLVDTKTPVAREAAFLVRLKEVAPLFFEVGEDGGQACPGSEEGEECRVRFG